MKYLKCIRNSSALDVVPGELYAITEERPGGYYKFLDRSGEQGFCKLEQSLVEFELVEDVTTVLKCYHAKEDDLCFTNGKLYVLEHDGASYYVDDDEGDYHEVSIVDSSDNEWRPVSSSARLLEHPQTESDETQCEYVCTEDEEELFRKLEQEQEKPVDCPVAIAYHIRELQKWLNHVGCSGESELRISSEYVWASPDEFVTYEAKEGGVGTLIEYMRHVGGVSKCVEKMEDVG